MTIVSGPEGLIAVATPLQPSISSSARPSGTAGLEAVLAAIESGKTIALANKEVLVMAGGIGDRGRAADAASRSCRSTASTTRFTSACTAATAREIRRLILTASGGPFREFSAEALDAASMPQTALQHPTWRMGREDHDRFGDADEQGPRGDRGALAVRRVRADQIDVVIHPQSIVHSMVELIDGSVIAQLGITDMRLPIQYACSYSGALGSARCFRRSI